MLKGKYDATGLFSKLQQFSASGSGNWDLPSERALFLILSKLLRLCIHVAVEKIFISPEGLPKGRCYKMLYVQSHKINWMLLKI